MIVQSPENVVDMLLGYGSCLVNRKEFWIIPRWEKQGPRFEEIKFCLQSGSSESLSLPTCNAVELAKQLIVLPVVCNRDWKIAHMVLYKTFSSSGVINEGLGKINNWGGGGEIPFHDLAIAVSAKLWVSVTSG